MAPRMAVACAAPVVKWCVAGALAQFALPRRRKDGAWRRDTVECAHHIGNGTCASVPPPPLVAFTGGATSRECRSKREQKHVSDVKRMLGFSPQKPKARKTTTAVKMSRVAT